MSIIKKLIKKGAISLPPNEEFIGKPIYEAITGSFSYGVSGDTSDMDVTAIVVPPKEQIYTHLTGFVPGFGPPVTKFDVINKHGITLTDCDKNYDVNIYSIIKFFNLCAENNPNMLEVLFVPDRCVTNINETGSIIRARRKEFLNKNSYHKLLGYAFSQLKKLETMQPTGKRLELVEKYGFDTKFAYHIIRLVEQCKQILLEGDLDLERSKELLKSIRSGQFTLEEIKKMFYEKELDLRQIYLKSDLPQKPNFSKINEILLLVLESHYGSLGELNRTISDAEIKLQKIMRILE